jgi:hypothetical protein
VVIEAPVYGWRGGHAAGTMDPAVMEGCEAAWRFFGGVFRTVISDNMGAVVDHADPLEPRLNQAFVEYAQSRGFLRASRLDDSHDAEMRKLIRVDLLIVDDFALQALDALDTADVYGLIVERHRASATVVTSNREPIEWRAMMADALLAQSAIDRLKSASHELVLDGGSYRVRQRPGVTDPDEPLTGGSRRSEHHDADVDNPETRSQAAGAGVVPSSRRTTSTPLGGTSTVRHLRKLKDRRGSPQSSRRQMRQGAPSGDRGHGAKRCPEGMP